MSEHLTTVGEMYDFLQKVKERKIVSVRDLTSREILLAEQLVGCQLLAKTSSRLNTFYTYGIDGIPEDGKA